MAWGNGFLVCIIGLTFVDPLPCSYIPLSPIIAGSYAYGSYMRMAARIPTIPST